MTGPPVIETAVTGSTLIGSAVSGPDVTIIAVGNRFGGDDALGIEVAGRLKSGRWGTEARVRFVELDGEPTRIIEAWRGARQAWVIDAMSSGAPPGSIVELNPDAIRARSDTNRAGGTHGAGVADAIAIGRAIGAMPGALRVFGVEGASFAPSDRLSPSVSTGRLVEATHVLDRALATTLDSETPSG